MSCGNPHETDCTEVIEAVYRYLDGEIDTVARARIHQHLDECGPCLRQYGIEREVRLLVARCCRSERAPEDLRSRIVVRLEQVRIEFGTTDPSA